jgi:ribosomal protein S7
MNETVVSRCEMPLPLAESQRMTAVMDLLLQGVAGDQTADFPDRLSAELIAGVRDDGRIFIEIRVIEYRAARVTTPGRPSDSVLQ